MTLSHSSAEVAHGKRCTWMAIVTGDRYLELLALFVEQQAGNLLDGTLVLKLNPVGLQYVQARLQALQELEELRKGAPVDYLRAYIADLGDHRALEKLRRVLSLLGSLLVVAVLPLPARDPTPITLLPFSKLKSLELRGCDLSTSAVRGILELRPILEKLVCHNSANALRHIFAEQIVEINVAQKWSRLAVVSCPYNGLYLMDESLQLLPAVDALDLSRNNFAKVANLKNCTQLKFLDLGFNHISSVTSLNQVVGTITKLVLRNNALVSTRGIETLLSLEALDLSCNIISNFHEVEALCFLPLLESLWLTGNPISVSSHYRVEVFSYFHDPSKFEVDGKPMTKLESWFMRRILSQRIEQRASYGIYVPATSFDAPLYDAGSSEALILRSRQAHRKKSTRLASIDELGAYKLATAVDSAQPDVQAAGAGLETASTGLSERREQVDPKVTLLIQQIEIMKREGSSTWLNDLVGFWDSDSRSRGRGDVVWYSENGSLPQLWRRGKEEVRRRFKDVAVPKDLREAVYVLETVTRADMGDIDCVESNMGLLQLREDGNGVVLVSPPHYDSALMHRRQNLVNEMLRLPLDLPVSSDGDSDSIDDHQADSMSERTSGEPSSPLSLVDKQIDFQELTSKFPDCANINKARLNKNNDEDAGASSPLHTDKLETGKSEKGMWRTVSVADESSSPVQFQAKDDVANNSGDSARQRKQKKTRRIVILDPEDDVEEFVGLQGSPLGDDTDSAPQLVAPLLSFAKNLSQPFPSNRSSSSSTRWFSPAFSRMAKPISSSPAKTAEIYTGLGSAIPHTSELQID